MPGFQISSVPTPPAISSTTHQVQAPKPPKSQSDHKPANAATSSRGPAVVLSGALAKAPERHGRPAPPDGKSQGQAQNQTPGQHINHVI